MTAAFDDRLRRHARRHLHDHRDRHQRGWHRDADVHARIREPGADGRHQNHRPDRHDRPDDRDRRRFDGIHRSERRSADLQRHRPAYGADDRQRSGKITGHDLGDGSRHLFRRRDRHRRQGRGDERDLRLDRHRPRADGERHARQPDLRRLDLGHQHRDLRRASRAPTACHSAYSTSGLPAGLVDRSDVGPRSPANSTTMPRTMRRCQDGSSVRHARRQIHNHRHGLRRPGRHRDPDLHHRRHEHGAGQWSRRRADQHGADGQTVSLATSPAFQDPNSGDTLTYSAIEPADGP